MTLKELREKENTLTNFKISKPAAKTAKTADSKKIEENKKE